MPYPGFRERKRPLDLAAYRGDAEWEQVILTRGVGTGHRVATLRQNAIDRPNWDGHHLALWAGEIKWSDRIGAKPGMELRHLKTLLAKQPKMKNAFFTTKTLTLGEIEVEGRFVMVSPTALYCYTVGKNSAQVTNEFRDLGIDEDDEEAIEWRAA